MPTIRSDGLFLTRPKDGSFHKDFAICTVLEIEARITAVQKRL
jgi:hypothetical protein